jgi:hypothetical protein
MLILCFLLALSFGACRRSSPTTEHKVKVDSASWDVLAELKTGVQIRGVSHQ